MEKGLIQVYTGNGKGKTTAALGVALSAEAHGKRVIMVQFMKGNVEYGEPTQSLYEREKYLPPL